MVEAYLNDPEFQEWFKRVFTLALLPLDSDETQFEILLNKMMNVLSLKREIGNNGLKFVEYALYTFLKDFFRKLYGITMKLFCDLIRQIMAMKVIIIK